MSLQLYEKAYLFDVVYGIEAMTASLANHVKSLRVISKCSYDLIGIGLNSGMPRDFGSGLELCEKARLFLKERPEDGWSD